MKLRTYSQKMRAEALSDGEMFYFTGKPCRHGHISKRYSNSSACERCRNIFNEKRRPKKKNKIIKVKVKKPIKVKKKIIKVKKTMPLYKRPVYIRYQKLDLDKPKNKEEWARQELVKIIHKTEGWRPPILAHVPRLIEDMLDLKDARQVMLNYYKQRK